MTPVCTALLIWLIVMTIRGSVWSNYSTTTNLILEGGFAEPELPEADRLD